MRNLKFRCLALMVVGLLLVSRLISSFTFMRRHAV